MIQLAALGLVGIVLSHVAEKFLPAAFPRPAWVFGAMGSGVAMLVLASITGTSWGQRHGGVTWGYDALERGSACQGSSLLSSFLACYLNN